MADAFSTPGEWIGIVTDRVALLLPPDVSPAAADQVFLAALTAQSPPDLLTAIASAQRVGLGDLPSFAIAFWSDDEIRVLLRGPVTALVDGTEHSAAGVTSWVEIRLAPGSDITLVGSAGAPGRSSTERFRIGRGVVRCASLSVAARDEAETTEQRGTAPVRVVQQAAPPEPEEPDDPSAGVGVPLTDAGYDHLFGPSVQRSVRSAAMWPALPDVAPSTGSTTTPSLADDPAGGDHDGRTLPTTTPTAPASDAPPSIVVSTGERVPIVRPTIVGRRPDTGERAATEVWLVTVPSPNQDISRNHVELRADGDTVTVRDLGTTNGTRLVRDHGKPVRLRPEEPYPVTAEDLVDLGDGITIRLEVGS